VLIWTWSIDRLTDADVSSSLAVQGLEQLNELELSHVQAFVDFLISNKETKEHETKGLGRAK